VGANVKAQLENDLKLELNAVVMYNASAQAAAENGDNASRELFTRLLKDEEGHADWLETQVGLIKEVGIENYLAQKV
jgi:bacterioferritin